MANANPIRTFSVTVDPVTPADVVVPVACDVVQIVPLTDASLFYQGSAGEAEIEILAGTTPFLLGGFAFGSGLVPSQARLPRFVAGDTVGRLRSSSGSGPAKLVCQ